MSQFNHSISRRALVRGLGLGFVALGAGQVSVEKAFAAPADGSLFGEQAEWVQKYESDARLSVPRTTTPILSAQTIAATEQAIAQYQNIAARGGWNAVPNQTMKLGTKSPAVVALRQRLMITGDLDETAGTSPSFDSYVEAGVKRFQARHGITATGVVAQQTIAALNVPAQMRARQLEINLVRLRAFSGNQGGRFVTMNIPGASVETVEGGMVVTHHQAGVGKIDRQSPVMQAKAVEINFNPFWTVPASIIRKDLIPKMQKDPNYLSDNKIRVFNSAGNEVAPNAINWNSMEATQYKFRQDPGGDVNSLGFIRINIPNPHGVYMHDTPAKGIFGDDFRFVSSGCVRVQNVRDYVAWLLKDTPGWDRDRIDEVIRSGERVDARITQAVPVYWIYVTAWSNDGLTQFRDDIYQRDGFGADAVTVSAASSSEARDGGLLEPMALTEMPRR